MLNLRNLRGGDCCRSQNGCCRHRACRVNRPANDGMGGDSGNMGNVENVKRVVFVGNPNVGKSSMFNALLGARTRTMNAPGTTVSITCGQYHYEKPKTAGNAQNWQFVDTPGTYSLAPMSPDEQVAVDALTGMSGMPVPDLAVVVLDATALSRSLYLLSMVVELGLPTVVALTMNDLAVRNGCGVDAERLSHLLDGMPVVAIDGRTGDGGKALADAIAASFEGTPVPHGLTALPTATADADMKTADGLSVWAESRADARLDWTAGILRGLDMHAVDHVTLSDRIDRVLLHPVIGVLVFLAVLFVVFQATTTLASPMQDWIDVTFRGWCTDGLDLLLGLFGPSVSGGWLRSLLVDGLLDGTIPKEQERYYLKIISSEVHRLARLVRSMLNLAKIEAGELKPNLQYFSVLDPIVDTLVTFEPRLEEKQIEIRGLDVDRVILYADNDLVHQVMYNLIENAIKFVDKGGYIEFHFEPEGNMTSISIRNSGEGLSEDELPLVFDRFYKTDKSRGLDKTGVGLGLNIVRSIIKLHGGKIMVRSVKNEYTEFVFTLPNKAEGD